MFQTPKTYPSFYCSLTKKFEFWKMTRERYENDRDENFGESKKGKIDLPLT